MVLMVLFKCADLDRFDICLLEYVLVLAPGTAPGCKRLSGALVASAVARLLVRLVGAAPTAPTMSRWYSAVELKTLIGTGESESNHC